MIRLFVIAISTALLLAPASAQHILSMQEYRDYVVQELKRQNPDVCVHVIDEGTINFGPSSEECSNAAWVGNHHRSYLDDPSSLNMLVDRFVRTMHAIMAGEDDLDDGVNRIVVVLRPQAYVAAYSGIFLSRPFAGDLVAVLMLDSEERLGAVTTGVLDELGIDEDQAFALAATNLRARMGPVEREKIYGVEVVGAESGLASGYLWLPEACTPTTPETLVLLPDREYYISATAGRRQERTAFWNIARGAIAAGDSLSMTPLACRQGEWVLAQP